MKISVNIPVVVEIEDEHGESGVDESARNLIWFLEPYTKKKLKYEFLGYVKRYAYFILYTSKSDPKYKKLRKEQMAEIKEYQNSLENDFCPTCGKPD